MTFCTETVFPLLFFYPCYWLYDIEYNIYNVDMCSVQACLSIVTINSRSVTQSMLRLRAVTLDNKSVQKTASM